MRYFVYLNEGVVRSTKHGPRQAKKFGKYEVLEVLDSPDRLYAVKLEWVGKLLKKGIALSNSKAEKDLALKLFFGSKKKHNGSVNNLRRMDWIDRDIASIKKEEPFTFGA